MSRLIDADEVVRQVETPYTEYPVMIEMRRAIKRMVDSAPTVDAVEVVKCKDCCYHEGEELGMVYCPNILGGGWVLKDFFCKNGSRGERK